MESKREVDQWDVIINSFWDAHKGNDLLTLLCSSHQGVDATMCTISTNYIDVIYTLLLKTIEYFVSIEASPGRSKNCTTFSVNVLYKFWRKFDPVILNISVKALVAPLDPKDIFDFVVVIQSHEKFSDHNVKTRA